MSQQATPPRTPTLTGTLIIGSGFSGLGMAVQLRRRGDDDFLILERARAVAGTWRDNHYPGCACDVESHLYSYSFERSWRWSRAFAPWNEIRDYMEHCTDKYDLRRHVRFDADVTTAAFDEPSGTWRVATKQGATYLARNVVVASGGLSNPAYPDIPGLDRFEGAKFHSAQWDHDFALTDKRVAVIGTGASAIQFVPAIQPEVKSLTLFQRTAPWVLPKPDFSIGPALQWVFRYLPFVAVLYRLWLYWKNELRVLAFKRHATFLRAMMPWGERFIRECIRDRALRRKLTPTYTPGCKRILMSNDYYPALGQPNVDVVTDPIAEVRAHSIVTGDGREIAVDAIIFGTGFAVQDTLGGMRVTGLHGAELAQRWTDGAEAYLGTVVPDFPNLYILLGPNTGLGHTSMILMAEAQIRYISDAIGALRRRALAFMNVKQAVHDRYNRWLQDKLRGTVWGSGCRSWYQHPSGKLTAVWPGFTFTFRWLTRRVRLGDYELRALPADAPLALPADIDASRPAMQPS